MFRVKPVYALLTMLLLGMAFISFMSVAADNGSSSGTQTTTTTSGTDQGSTSTNDTNTQHHDNTTDNGIPDQIESQQQRSIQVELDNSSKEVHIQSQSMYGNISNKIQFELNAKEEVSMEFQYQSNTASGNQTNLQVSMEFKQLVEFIDNSTNPNNIMAGLNPGDTILKTIDFSTINWTLNYSTTTISNQTLYTVSIIGQINGTTIQFNFHLASSFIQINQNSILQPTAVKIDVIIKNYAYSSTNSQLALKTNFGSSMQSKQISNTTEDQIDHLTTKNESAVNFGNNQYGGFFSWANQLLVDGKNMSVVTSPVMTDPEDSSGQTTMLYFSFPYGNVLVWDPKIGVAMSSLGINLNSTVFSQITFQSSPINNSQNTPVLGFILVVAALPIVGIATIYLRRIAKKD